MLGEHLSTLERTKGASSLAHCSAAPSHSVCSLPSGRSCEPPEGVRVGGGRGGGAAVIDSHLPAVCLLVSLLPITLKSFLPLGHRTTNQSALPMLTPPSSQKDTHIQEGE